MSDLTSIHHKPVTQLCRELRDGALSARALLDHYLERIERLNPQLNAFIALDAGAGQAADDSDARLRAGRPRGPLDGIPVAIKDNILVRGLPAVWGSEFYRDFVPDHDELPVALLREGGAVILGKTNVPEFTLRGFTGNPVFGVTRNPWNTDLTPGGSSGGSVAAVAAGLVPLTLGTDGGGSIRRPASYTNLVGLKPSVGRIPRADGFPGILFDCEIVGPIGRRIADVALMMDAIARPHPADQRSRGLPVFAWPQDALKPLRILFVEQFGQAPVDPEILDSCRKAAWRLAELGHEVQTGALPFSVDELARIWPKIGNVGLSMLARRDKRFLETASAAFIDQAIAGDAISGAEYLDILELLFAFRATAGRAFQTVDVIMTPAAAAQPWPAAEQFPPIIDGREAGPRGHAVFTGWVNACGHPGLVVPSDPAAGGLPIGIQLVGDYGSDAQLLQLGAQYEEAHPWADRWPELAESL